MIYQKVAKDAVNEYKLSKILLNIITNEIK